MRDIRVAVRKLLRAPLFTAIAVLTLAVGIGANTAIFSVVNAVLIQPLPYPESEDLVYIGFQAPGLGYDEVPFSDAFYVHFRSGQRSFSGMAMWGEEEVHLTGEGTPERLDGAMVTPGFFELLRSPPALGRGFTAEEGGPGAEPVAIVSHGLWQRRFGGDPTIVGRTIRLDGVARRVVGVAPASLDFPSEETATWRPLVIDEADLSVGNFSWAAIARLGPGVTADAARADMRTLLALVPEAFPEEFSEELLTQARFDPVVRPLKELIVGEITRPLWVILGTVGFVLLIACANVANLFLVRAEARQREIAVRTALGAGRGTLARYFLAESLLLALVGGTLGIGLALGGIRWLAALAPASIPRLHEVGLDLNVLLFTAAASVFAGLAFGGFPIARYGRQDLALALKQGGRRATSDRVSQRARNALIVVQVALALVLLVGCGLMLRSFQALRAIDPGFDERSVLTVQVALPGSDYPVERRAAFWRRLVDRIETLPGVMAVGMTDHIPLAGGRNAGSIDIEGHETAEGDIPPLASRRVADPGYFGAMRIPVLDGRGFQASDGANGFRAAVISQSFAAHWWPGESALGKRVRRGESEDWYEVVGVVEDVRFLSLEDAPDHLLYLPLVRGSSEAPDVPANMSLVIRTASDPRSLIPAVREQVWALDPNLPIANPRTLAGIVADSMSRTSFTMLMLGIAAAVALLLGAVGIYGVISYVVSQRTREIGVRMALGAHSRDVSRMVVRHGLRLAGAGVLLGLAVAVALSSLLAALLYGVRATDIPTYAAVALVLLGSAGLASWIPARRAAAIDPLQALRNE